MTLPTPPSFRAVVVYRVTMQIKIATASMSREISLVYGNVGVSPHSVAITYNIVIGNYRVDLSTLFPILFLQFSTFRRILPFKMTLGRLIHQCPDTSTESVALYELCATPPLLNLHASLLTSGQVLSQRNGGITHASQSPYCH